MASFARYTVGCIPRALSGSCIHQTIWLSKGDIICPSVTYFIIILL